MTKVVALRVKHPMVTLKLS